MTVSSVPALTTSAPAFNRATVSLIVDSAELEVRMSITKILIDAGKTVLISDIAERHIDKQIMEKVEKSGETGLVNYALCARVTQDPVVNKLLSVISVTVSEKAKVQFLCSFTLKQAEIVVLKLKEICPESLKNIEFWKSGAKAPGLRA
jgi:hypothetical protein